MSFQSTIAYNKTKHRNIPVQAYRINLNVYLFLSLKTESYQFFSIFRNLNYLIYPIFFRVVFTYLSISSSVLKMHQFICCSLHLHTYQVSMSKFIIMLFLREL